MRQICARAPVRNAAAYIPVILVLAHQIPLVPQQLLEIEVDLPVSCQMVFAIAQSLAASVVTVSYGSLGI